ncbi:MAG: hypothetical protein ACXIUD_17380 [Mongoliitalea sp.]
MFLKFLRRVKWLYVYPYFRDILKDQKLNKELLTKYNLQNVSVSKLKRYKTSDTLFILAAGQSINNLSDSNFQEIENANSIGINGFAHHNFVPTFHSFELENQHNPIALSMFLNTSKNIIRLKEKYSKTAVIFRQHKIIDNELENNFKIISSWGNSYWNIYDQIPGNNIEEYKLYLDNFFKKGLMNKDDFFPNRSSSLSWVISMAYQLKYRRVILCGVDLFGDHFYINSSSLTKEEYEKQKNKIHLTGNKTSKYPVVIQDIIDLWNQKYFKEYGAKLFVSSEYSLLSKILPVYKFKSS